MRSKKWFERLSEEVRGWVTEKIIDSNQAQRILTKYANQKEDNRFVSSVYVLGSVLIGLGLILFVASNWQHIGKIAKIALIFSLIVVFNLAGYRLRFERNDHPKVGESLLFLGAVSFGAGLWLVAQIFQIPYNYAQNLLFWMLGILPIAWLLRSPSILILTSLLVPVWLNVAFFNNPERVVASFFIWIALLLAVIYREKQKTALFFGLVTILIWLSQYLYVALHDMTLHGAGPGIIELQLLSTNLFIACAFLFYRIGMAHDSNEKFHNLAIVYKSLAVLIILLSNYWLTFMHHYHGLVGFGAAKVRIFSFSYPLLLTYLLYLCAAMVPRIPFFKTQQESGPKKEETIVLALVVLQIIGMNSGILDLQLVSVYHNILLFAAIMSFLYLGYLLKEESLFRLCLVAFGLDVLTRYFDMFWKILPRSLFFMAGGVLLIAGAVFLEKKRKALEQKMKEETPS